MRSLTGLKSTNRLESRFDRGFSERLECWGVEHQLGVRTSKDTEVSRVFRTLVWAERRPALAQAGIAPLICWSFSNSMFRYLLVDHAVPAMWRSLAAARLSAD